eukprot:COSAG04_NODE_1964_length_5118_cov_53.889221_10_plen_102_part_00
MGKGKMCEDCGKNAHFGLKGGKKQWCSGCAKRHGGVRLGKRQMCEDCKGKHANYGLAPCDTTLLYREAWCHKGDGRGAPPPEPAPPPKRRNGQPRKRLAGD